MLFYKIWQKNLELFRCRDNKSMNSDRREVQCFCELWKSNVMAWFPLCWLQGIWYLLWFIPQIRSVELERTSLWCREENHSIGRDLQISSVRLPDHFRANQRLLWSVRNQQCWHNGTMLNIHRLPTTTSRSKDRKADALGNLLLCSAITLALNLQHQKGRDNNSVLSSCFNVWTLWIQLLTKPISKMYLCACNKHHSVLRRIAEEAVLVTCHDTIAHPLFCFW